MKFIVSETKIISVFHSTLNMGFLENMNKARELRIDRLPERRLLHFLRHEVFIADHIISINLLNITGNINSVR